MKRLVFSVLLLLLSAHVGAQTFVGATNPPQSYGTQGSSIPLGAVNLPKYASVVFAGDSTYQWAPGATCWYSPGSFTITVTLTDGLTHQIALDVQDYDRQGRSESISAGTTAAQTVSAFTSPRYLVWDISGVTVFTVKTLAGPNVVVNGLYFDAGPGGTVTPPPATTLHSVTISWTAPAQASTTFNLYRNGVKLVSGLTVAQYVDATVLSGTSYTYSATTVNAGVESAQAPVQTILFSIPTP